MKKQFLFLIISLTYLISFSQVKFNKIYENQENPYIRNVFSIDTGYYSVGGNYYNNLVHIDINYFNSLGDWQWNKHIGNGINHYYHGSENACIKTLGGYLLAGSINGPSDTNMIYIVKFDEQFDTLWTRKYFVDTNFVVARGVCNTDDGGFMVVGETELKSDSTIGTGYNYGLMLKLDANGNYEWFRSFGTDFHSDNFYKAVQTHDGGYLVGGATMSWQESLAWIDQGDWYIVKTDAQGNEEWHRRYGNPIYDDGRITQILRTRDTSYYITGSWTYHRNSTGSDKWKEAYIVKLDKNFNDVYELKYDNQAYWRSLPMAAIETSDSNIVLIGAKYTDY